MKAAYNNMPLPTQAEVGEKLVAAATTEKVAMTDIYFGDNMNRVDKDRIKNAFIYGDILKTSEEAARFVRAAGYTGDMDKILFINKKQFTYEDIVNKIAMETGIGTNNKQYVGIRAIKDELRFAEQEVDKGVLLEIQPINMNGQDIYVTINSYQTLLNMVLQLTAEGQLPPGVLPKDERGIFRYLPRTVPIDYEKEIRSYIEAVEVIRTAA
jgi:hypothetical protein